MIWRGKSLIYPSVAFLLLIILSTLAVGYLINYSILRDILYERVESRATLVTGKIQEHLALKIERVSRFKDSWLDTMTWLAQEPSDYTGPDTAGDEIKTFREKWEKVRHFFPYWKLDFLMIVNDEGLVTHHLPDTLVPESQFTADQVKSALAEGPTGGTWLNTGPTTGQWSIQVFMPVRISGDETRLVIFGFSLAELANQLLKEHPNHLFMLATEMGPISSTPVTEELQLDPDSIALTIRENHPRIEIDEGLEWNLYYTPIRILDQSFCLIIPVSPDSTRQVMAVSSNRLAASGLFIILVLILAGIGLNLLILSPLHRLREKAAALVHICSPEEPQLGPQDGEKGNEITMVELALKSASTKLYADLSQLRESKELLEGLALKDPVTGFLNDRMFLELLRRALLECRRKGRVLSVLIIDLVRLNPAWENLGHELGNQLLQEFARRLGADVRGEDLLFRLDNQRFATFIPECGDERLVLAIARRIEQALSRPYDVVGQACHLGVNIGISLYPEHGDSVKGLVKKAGMAAQEVGENDAGHCRLFYSS
ncbi:MAG: diguanylate cyclase [Gammaproteobacteria bacterium]|nr:diguanylate cyclase [Gammaproteobacteria bacterium]